MRIHGGAKGSASGSSSTTCRPALRTSWRDDRGVQAGGIVLNCKRVCIVIEAEPSDAVYLARVGKCEGDRLRGRRGVAEHNVDGRHRHRIAVRCDD